MLRERDAADLADDPDVPVPWLPLLGFDGYIVQGLSHLLSAYSRMGKTELITETMFEWLKAGHRIVYFTEEPDALWRERMKRRKNERGIVWPRGLQLVFALGAESKELLWRLQNGEEDIVFVDTVRNILCPWNENDNSELARLIIPWIRGARDTNKTSIFVHHDRKSPGDHGRGISGGHALMATCDIILEILGVEGDATQRKRIIKPMQRVWQTPELEYDWEDGRIVRVHSAGDASDNGLLSVESRVMLQMTDEWQITAELMTKMGDNRPSPEQLRRALNDLAERGKIYRDPPLSEGEVKGKTVRWKWIAPEVQLPVGALHA